MRTVFSDFEKRDGLVLVESETHACFLGQTVLIDNEIGTKQQGEIVERHPKRNHYWAKPDGLNRGILR